MPFFLGHMWHTSRTGRLNSALKKLLSDKSEKLVDIIGRQGILKNVNNLYIASIFILSAKFRLFVTRPLEMKDEVVSPGLHHMFSLT